MITIENDSKRCACYLLVVGFALVTFFGSVTVSPYNPAPTAISTATVHAQVPASQHSLRDPEEKLKARERLRQQVLERKRIEQERKDQERYALEEQRRYCFDRIRRELLQNVLSVVSPDRQFATLWIALQALDVAGDFIELGVAKGGMTIVMKSLLVCTSDTRNHWMADSWQGLPNISEIPAEFQGKDFKTSLHPGQFTYKFDQFKANLAKWKQYWEADGYVWPDDDPHILRGLFHDAVPKAPLGKLAFARCDGDIYSSTYECLQYTYPLLSCGGYVYIDDYWEFQECEDAVRDYTKKYSLSYNLYTIHPAGHVTVFDGPFGAHPSDHVEAAFWKKTC